MALPETTLSPKAQPAVRGDLTGRDLPKLTKQQLAFVEALTSGKHSQSSAYNEAYPASLKWPRNWVWVAASRTASHPKVRLWLEHAWDSQVDTVNRSAKGHVYRLENIQRKALMDKQYGAALGAEKAHAEALGHRRDDGEAAVSITIKQYQGDKVIEDRD